MSIETTHSPDGKTLTICILGRLDYSTHGDFRKAYEGSDGPNMACVVDLEQVDYVDSSGLGMLLVLKEFAGGDGASVKMVHAQDDVRRILEIANFDRLFELS